jgi:phage-related protein
MSNAVRLSLAVDADTADAAAAFDKVGAAAKGMADDVDAAARDADSGMSSFGDSADNAGSSAATAAGAFGDLGGALAMMPGPLGAIGAGMETAAPAIQGVTGATDLLSLAMNSNLVMTVRNTVATIASTTAAVASAVATQAMAAAQWLLNAALSANPIGLIVIAIAALVAGLIIAYKKSESFRNIVQTGMAAAVVAFDLVKTAVGAVWGAIQTLIGWVGKITIPGLIKTAFDNIGTAVGAVSTAIDKMIGWVGKVSIPQVVKDLADPFNLATTAIDAVSTAIDKLIGWIGKIDFPSIPKGFSSILPGRAAPATAGAGVGATRAAPGLAGAGGGGIVVNVYGAVDSYQTAQQIKRVLARGAYIGGRVTP